MPLINVVIVLIVVGVILWLVNNYIPMDRKIKSILNVVVIIVVVLWLLSAFGIFNSLSTSHWLVLNQLNDAHTEQFVVMVWEINQFYFNIYGGNKNVYKKSFRMHYYDVCFDSGG